MRLSRIPPQAAWAAAILLSLSSCGQPSSNQQASLTPVPPDPAPGEVYGVVTLNGAGDSSGIQVFIPGGSALAMTDAQGHFVVSGLKPGVYSFSAQHAGYKTEDLGQIEVRESRQKDRYRLREARLDPAQAAGAGGGPGSLGSIKGRVRTTAEASADGKIPETRIELEGTPMRTVTDPDGSFYLWNLTAGKYSLVATMQGFQPYHVPVEVAAGDAPTVVDIAFTGEQSDQVLREIHGSLQLFEADDSPTNEFNLVKVGVRELPDLKVSIEPDGTFRIGPLAAQVYNVYAVAEGYGAPADIKVDTSGESAQEITIALRKKAAEPEKPGQLTGSVVKNVEPRGSMSGISVALTGTSFLAVTDAQGRYRITGVPPGTYEVLAQADGFEPASIPSVEIGSGAEVKVEDLLLEPTLDYPVVVDTDPKDGFADFAVRYDMPITVRFNKKVRPESVKAAISIRPAVDFKIFAGKESPGTDFDLALIMIDGSSETKIVHFETAYQLTIADSVVDFDGLQMQEPFVLRFRTGKAAVISTIPAEGEKEAVLQPARPVVFQFNAKIDQKSFRAEDIKIKPGIGIIPTIQLADDPKTGWSALHIQTGVWQQDTEYTITLSRRIKTIDGKYLSNTPYTLKFRTVKLRQLQSLGATPR